MNISKETIQLLDFERIRLLYKNGLYGLIGVLVNGILSLLFFWDKVNSSILLIWIALIFVIGMTRWFLVIVFNAKLKNQQVHPDNIQGWELWFYAGYSLSGVVWSTTILFPFEDKDLLNSLIFITLVHVGMISAANTIYSTSLLSIRTYLTITMLPLMLKLFLLKEEPFIIVGFMCSAYYVFMIRLTKVLNKTIIGNIELKIENENLSLRDSLTGLWNRRRLYLFMEKLLPQIKRTQTPLSLILFDVDFFKKYNDANGHNAGDKLLVQISEIMQNSIRDEDLAVRYGGEEFLIVLPNTNLNHARQIGERIHKLVKENTSVTISGGLVCHSEELSFEELVLRADKLLYKAKEKGRDQIIFAPI